MGEGVGGKGLRGTREGNGGEGIGEEGRDAPPTTHPAPPDCSVGECLPVRRMGGKG